MTETTFDLTSGRLCLDFVNALEDRAFHLRQERLHTYGDLLSWSQQAGLINAAEADRLFDVAESQPARAAEVLARAVHLREALYQIFSTTWRAEEPESASLEILNAELSTALSHARIIRSRIGFTWQWADRDAALDQMLWPVVRSAAELLTSTDLLLVRECASTSCTFLFLDTSRNHRRQWCDMKTCGNRAKARRFHARQKAGAARGAHEAT